MKKLLELEAKLKKAKEELEKNILASMNPVSPIDSSSADGSTVAKEESPKLKVKHIEHNGRGEHEFHVFDGDKKVGNVFADPKQSDLGLNGRLKGNYSKDDHSHVADQVKSHVSSLKKDNMGKEDVETCGKMDSKKDQKIIAEALDDYNENKHGEAKDVDSAKKSDIPKEITDQSTGDIVGDAGDKGPLEKQKMVKFYKNGQWSMD